MQDYMPRVTAAFGRSALSSGFERDVPHHPRQFRVSLANQGVACLVRRGLSLFMKFPALRRGSRQTPHGAAAPHRPGCDDSNFQPWRRPLANVCAALLCWLS